MDRQERDLLVVRGRRRITGIDDGRRPSAQSVTEPEPRHDVRRERSIVAQQDALRGEHAAGLDTGSRVGRPAVRRVARAGVVALVTAIQAADVRSADERDVDTEVQTKPILLVGAGRARDVIADVALARGAHARRTIGVRLAARRRFADAAFAQQASFTLGRILALATPIDVTALGAAA